MEVDQRLDIHQDEQFKRKIHQEEGTILQHDGQIATSKECKD